MEKIKKESVLSLLLPYTVTKYAYKETAHIVLILSRAWEIFCSILFYYASTARVDMSSTWLVGIVNC